MLSVLRQSRATLFCFALCSIFTIEEACGQFTTILNIPPDPNIGDNESIGSDTQLNLSDGGAIGDSFDAGVSDGTSTNVEVNICGGSVGDNFFAQSGSAVNLLGIRFVLDGSDLTASLTTGAPFTITDRDVTLSGLLADGSPFSFDLNSTNGPYPQELFDPLALLTVTLVAPGDGDFDGNSVVDGADFLKWQRDPSVGSLADWEANYGTSGPPLSSESAAVPEPASLLLVVSAVGLLLLRARKA